MNISELSEELMLLINSNNYYKADESALEYLRHHSIDNLSEKDVTHILNILRRSPCNFARKKWALEALKTFPKNRNIKKSGLVAQIDNGEYLIVYDDFREFAFQSVTENEILLAYKIAKKNFDYILCAELIRQKQDYFKNPDALFNEIEKLIHLNAREIDIETDQNIEMEDLDVLTKELKQNSSRKALARILISKSCRNLIFDSSDENIDVLNLIRNRFGNHFLLAYCLKDWSERRDASKCQSLYHLYSAYDNYRSCYQLSKEWIQQDPLNPEANLNYRRFSDIVGENAIIKNWNNDHSYESNILGLRQKSSAQKHFRVKEPRIAVCISGQLRGYSIAGKSIISRIINPANADVYVATWDTTGTSLNKQDNFSRLCRVSPDQNKLRDTLSSKDRFRSILPHTYKYLISEHKVDADTLKDFYGSSSVKIVSEKHFEQKYSKHPLWNRRPRLLKMLHQIKAANDLKKAHEEKHGKYDYIIRLRPDKKVISFDLDLAISKIRTENTFCTQNLGWDQFFLGDQFYFCRSHVSDSLAAIWENLGSLADESAIPRHYRRGLKHEGLMFDHVYGSGSDISIYSEGLFGRFVNTPDPDALFSFLIEDMQKPATEDSKEIANQIISSISDEINET